MITAKEVIDRFNQFFGSHPGARAVHAKGEFYSGSFAANDWATERCAAEPLAGAEHPVLVRWSNGSGHPRARDTALDLRGMAVSIRGSGGAIDLVAITLPRFPVRTPEQVVQFTRTGAKKEALPGFVLRNPRAIPAMLAGLRAKSMFPPKSYAAVPYFAIHAYKWIASNGTESWVRYRLTPAGSTTPDGKFEGRDMLREELRARVAAGPITYALDVQVAAHNEDPHDPMSVWKGDWTTAGHMQIREQIPDPEAGGNIVVFDPTRVVDGIELSNDPILLFRAEAYSESATRRMQSHAGS